MSRNDTTAPFHGKPRGAALTRQLKDLEEALGVAVDRLESLLAAAELPLPAATHLAGLVGGIKSIAKDMRDALRRAGGAE